MNYQECVNYILDIPKFSKVKSMGNCSRILEYVGSPDKKIKYIHVAGTNGKGSTCAFMNSILLEMNKKVGLFTSPHLVKINERIKINGCDISDDAFTEAVMIIQDAINELYHGEYCPTFFEYMFLVALVTFDKAGVEFAILETGMGGRLDATNIIEKPMVSVITSISMDHMEILGDTIDKISMEKAGIIKKGVPVCFYGENPIVDEVIRKTADEVGTVVLSVKKADISKKIKKNKVIDFLITNMYDRYGVLSIPFVMEYQCINATLAIMAMEQIFDDKLTSEHVRLGLMKTVWRGRMEEVLQGVYVDGAHNYEGIQEFVKYVNEVAAEHPVHILFSVVKEKEYYSMMELISSISNCKGYYVAPVKNARALVADDMAEFLTSHVSVPVYKYDSLDCAIEDALHRKEEEDVLFCTGSLYMVGELKQVLAGCKMEEKND